MDCLLQVFKALANDRRLAMVELLIEKGELRIDLIETRVKRRG